MRNYNGAIINSVDLAVDFTMQHRPLVCTSLTEFFIAPLYKEKA
jgi:hypothetical protein